MWTIADALNLCRRVEEVAAPLKCHVALTGGCLYKDGYRKDLDILFYRERQVEMVNREYLFSQLTKIGITVVKEHGWLVKAKYEDKPIDCFFPEWDDALQEGGGYP